MKRSVGVGLCPLSWSRASGPVRWNFEKFLVDRQGRVVARYPSRVKPQDTRLVAEIERLLAQSP